MPSFNLKRSSNKKEVNIITEQELNKELSSFTKIGNINGFNYNEYFINKNGIIISTKRSTPIVLKPKIRNGYYTIGLRDTNGERKLYGYTFERVY